MKRRTPRNRTLLALIAILALLSVSCNLISRFAGKTKGTAEVAVETVQAVAQEATATPVSQPADTPTATPQAESVQPVTGGQEVESTGIAARPTDEMVMVHIPPGEFTMGADKPPALPNEKTGTQWCFSTSTGSIRPKSPTPSTASAWPPASATSRSAGPMPAIRPALRATTSPLWACPGFMPGPTASGPAPGCPARPSGKRPRAGQTAVPTPGATRARMALKPTCPARTIRSSRPRPWAVSRPAPAPTACWI